MKSEESLSFDHLICPKQYVGRNREADLLRCFEIYDEFKLRGLLDRQIGRLGTFEDLAYVGRRAPIQIRQLGRVRHQTAIFHVFPPRVHSGQSVICREREDLFSIRGKYRAGIDGESMGTSLDYRLECPFQIISAPHLYGLNLQPTRGIFAGCCA